jgi:hypothetical protein
MPEEASAGVGRRPSAPRRNGTTGGSAPRSRPSPGSTRSPSSHPRNSRSKRCRCRKIRASGSGRFRLTRRRCFGTADGRTLKRSGKKLGNCGQCSSRMAGSRSRIFARPSTTRPGLLPRFVETKSSWRSCGPNRDPPPWKERPDEALDRLRDPASNCPTQHDEPWSCLPGSGLRCGTPRSFLP